jgi:hypothetical protein
MSVAASTIFSISRRRSRSGRCPSRPVRATIQSSRPCVQADSRPRRNASPSMLSTDARVAVLAADGSGVTLMSGANRRQARATPSATPRPPRPEHLGRRVRPAGSRACPGWRLARFAQHDERELDRAAGQRRSRARGRSRRECRKHPVGQGRAVVETASVQRGRARRCASAAGAESGRWLERRHRRLRPIRPSARPPSSSCPYRCAPDSADRCTGQAPRRRACRVPMLPPNDVGVALLTRTKRRPNNRWMTPTSRLVAPGLFCR